MKGNFSICISLKEHQFEMQEGKLVYARGAKELNIGAGESVVVNVKLLNGEKKLIKANGVPITLRIVHGEDAYFWIGIETRRIQGDKITINLNNGFATVFLKTPPRKREKIEIVASATVRGKECIDRAVVRTV